MQWLTVLGAAVIGSLALLVSASAQDTASNEPRLQETLRQRFPTITIKAVIPSASWPGMFEVVTPSELVYTNADGSLLFSGTLIETATRKNLTAERWSAVSAVDVAKLPLDLAITEVKGDGSRKLFVFADPDCPYCRDLEKQMQAVSDVTVHTFLYPLEEIHPGASAKAVKIWCSEDRQKAWNDWMVRSVSPADTDCQQTVVGSVEKLGRQLDISSTPTLILADGRRINGLIPMERLEAEMNFARDRIK